jgi:hypothetical protein
MVTGPSLINLICISAPKLPVCIGLFTNLPIEATKYSYKGIAIWGFADLIKEGLLPFLVDAYSVN